MPFKYCDVNLKSNGGTELVSRALEKKLTEKAPDLLENFDLYPSRVRNFDASRPSVYILHDLPGDPESDHLKHDKGSRWNAMVFVSHWQHQQYQSFYQFNGDNAYVVKNAIEPFNLDVKSKFINRLGTPENPVKLIYHTTPHRGLEILVPVFEHLYESLKQQGVYIELNVYSSFSIYGWQQRDAQYQELFDRCRQHPAINYHGAVSNDEVRQALQQSHIFAFPSIWPETSCIAMIEAMAAGNLVVHSNLAALPETAAGMTFCYPFVSSLNDHAGRFCEHLMHAIFNCINNAEEVSQMLTFVSQRTNITYSWDNRIDEWVGLLSNLKRDIATSSLK